MDIAGATTAILIFFPVMAATVIFIKLDSKGPFFFKQKRVGLGGKIFNCYKFRSMVVDADKMVEELSHLNERKGPVFKMTDDPRVTKIGRFIRKWSIDEMPQFFNVLNGDMSLVGPRPPIASEVQKYLRWHGRRLEVKPGITCLWQIHARHGSSFEEWVRLDIRYAQSISLWLDIKILILTIPAVISGKGAY